MVSRLATILHLPLATIIDEPPATDPDTPPGHTVAEFLNAGVSYRELDYWTRTSRLHAVDEAPGSGHNRTWQPGEVQVAALTKRLTRAGLNLDVAFTAARGQHQLAPGIRLHIDQEDPC